jgi:hypothetical protein
LHEELGAVCCGGDAAFFSRALWYRTTFSYGLWYEGIGRCRQSCESEEYGGEHVVQASKVVKLQIARMIIRSFERLK